MLTGGGGRSARGVLACLSLFALPAVAACSGSESAGDDASPVTASLVSTTHAATTIPATTQVVVTTIAPATTTPTTTAAPTTTATEPAPSTTTLDDLRAEIEADLNEGETALVEGGASPESAASIDQLSDFFTGASLDAARSIYERLSRQGNAVRPNPDIPSSHRVLEVVSSSTSRAEILNCRIDSGITYSVDGEQIVDDSIVRTTALNIVSLQDGTWRLAGGEILTRTEGDASCDV